jgi:hypothetical protein
MSNPSGPTKTKPLKLAGSKGETKLPRMTEEIAFSPHIKASRPVKIVKVHLRVSFLSLFLPTYQTR